MHALSKRNPPEEFAVACGEHHDAEADTKAVAVILFDEAVFGTNGLYHCVFKSTKKCFQPIAEIWDAMEIKMKEPVVSFAQPPPGWIEAEAINKRNRTHLFYLLHFNTFNRTYL